MVRPKVLILRAPGTNCDAETAFAFELSGAQAQRMHINRWLEKPNRADDFQILCVPGGFSYGDDIAAGRILSNQIEHHLADCLQKFKADGKLILGICNGFQVLIRTGILLQSDADERAAATLTVNDSGKFEDRWVRLGARGSKSVFLSGIQSMYLPVAHAEGKFATRDAQTLRRLETDGQLVLRYESLQSDNDSSGNDSGGVPYPDNPNGSVANVAGVSDTTGRVLGLMPHPERHIDPTHHPRWTRGDANDHDRGDGTGDGLKVFENAVGYFL